MGLPKHPQGSLGMCIIDVHLRYGSFLDPRYRCCADPSAGMMLRYWAHEDTDLILVLTNGGPGGTTEFVMTYIFSIFRLWR